MFGQTFPLNYLLTLVIALNRIQDSEEGDRDRSHILTSSPATLCATVEGDYKITKNCNSLTSYKSNFLPLFPLPPYSGYISYCVSCGGTMLLQLYTICLCKDWLQSVGTSKGTDIQETSSISGSHHQAGEQTQQ